MPRFQFTNEVDLSAPLARRLLCYNPATGILTWRERDREHCSSDQGWRMFNTRYPGMEAGCLDPSGYVKIKLGGRQFMAHRVAFLIERGHFPGDEVDHINGDRTDNRLKNLRLVTSGENKKNLKRRSNNTSGATGVSWDSRPGKWLARVMNNGHRVFLGHFDDWFEAVCAVRSGMNRYGYHPNHGRVA